MREQKNAVDGVDAAQPVPVPVPEAAWAKLDALQLAAQVSQQQLQIFVDGLALGQGVAQGALLTQMPQGGWAWVEQQAAPEAMRATTFVADETRTGIGNHVIAEA